MAAFIPAGVPIPPDFDIVDAVQPGGQFGGFPQVPTPGGVGGGRLQGPSIRTMGNVGDLEQLLRLMTSGQGPIGRGPVPLPTPSVDPFVVGSQAFAERQNPRLGYGGSAPGGGTSSPVFAAGRRTFGDPARAGQLEALLQVLQQVSGPRIGLESFRADMPPGSSSGGNPSNAATASGGSNLGGIAPEGNAISTSAGPNTGGVMSGMTAAEAIGQGFGALSGINSAADTVNAGFNAISGTGFNASPTAATDTVGLGLTGTGLGPNTAAAQAEAVAGIQAAVAEATQAALDAGFSPDAATAIGVAAGQAAAAGAGDGGSGGTGIGGVGDAGGVGMDGSSNAGIGGPGGTGAVGSAGDAGQGTGGPGEGDMYGGHFTVGGDPSAGPDSMNVRFKASPGEHVVVVPQGMTPGQILSRPEQMSSWRMTGRPANPGPGPTPSAPIPPGTPANSPGGIEAILRQMQAGGATPGGAIQGPRPGPRSTEFGAVSPELRAILALMAANPRVAAALTGDFPPVDVAGGHGAGTESSGAGNAEAGGTW